MAKSLRTSAYTVELADLRSKDLYLRVILVHGDREVDKCRHVVSDGIRLPRVRVEQPVRLIAHRPEEDGVEKETCAD